MVRATDILACADVRAAVDAHAMSWFPKECCGLLVTGPEGHTAVLADNGIDAAHAANPAKTPRTGAYGYQLDPLEILRSEQRGETLIAIFHSHCGADAYFSDEDRRGALNPSAKPWYPGVEYVVLDAQPGGVRDFKVFAWSNDTKDFIEA